MKNKIIGILLVLILLISSAVMLSCGEKENPDDTGETGTETTLSAEDPAIAETRAFFEKMYIDLNNANYAALKNYYDEPEEIINEKIANFEFMAAYFTVEYEIADITATYLENGDIGADVVVLAKSTNNSSEDFTITKEPNSYLLKKTDGVLKIASYAAGDIEIIVGPGVE